MIFTLFIIPLVILISGFLMYKYPPKKINYFIGYRTRKSMKNDKNWKILNKHCGKVWIKLGLILLLIITLFVILLKLFKIIILTETILIIIILFQILILIITSCFIEMTYKD